MILFFLLLLFLILGIRSWIEPTVEERLSYQSRVLVTASDQPDCSRGAGTSGCYLPSDDSSDAEMAPADHRFTGRYCIAQSNQKRHYRASGRTPAGIIFPQIIHSFGFLGRAENPFGTGTVCFVPAVPESVVMTNLYHEFTQAGVNQTRHRVYLQIDMEISAVIPGFSMRTQVSTNMELGQTVIVGEVPEFLVALELEGG